MPSQNHFELVDQGVGQVLNSFSNECDVNGDTQFWRKRKSPGSGLSGICTLGSNANNVTSNATMTTAVDVSGLGINTDSIIGTRSNSQTNNETNNNSSGGLVRSTRRTAASSVLGGTTPLSGTQNCMAADEGRTKLNVLGFPIDHALNKEGYRQVYICFCFIF